MMLAFSVSEIFFERASEVKITLGLIIPRTRSRSVDLYHVGTSAKTHSHNKEPSAAQVEDAEDSIGGVNTDLLPNGAKVIKIDPKNMKLIIYFENENFIFEM